MLEILDTIFLLGFIVFIYLANKHKPGSWWKAGIVCIIIGAIIGFGLTGVFPQFDKDLFPLLVVFLVSGIWLYISRRKK